MEVICSGWLSLYCFLFLLHLPYIAAPVIQLHTTVKWTMNSKWNICASTKKVMGPFVTERINRFFEWMFSFIRFPVSMADSL